MFQFVLAFLLFGSLDPVPGDYFEFLRIVVVVFFSIGAVRAYRMDRKGLLIFSLLVVVLFQPFLKIDLGRFLWNAVNIILGIYLLGDLVSKRLTIR